MADLKKQKNYIKNIVITFILVAFICIQFFIISTNIKADSFYTSGGNINYCHLAMTTSVSYRDLPNNDIVSGLTFDSNKVSGESGNYPATHRFAPNLGTLAYPKPERYRSIAESIKVPPLTTVDLGYYTHNYSGHTINITDAWVFVSKPNPDEGDWTRLGSPGNFGALSWNLDGRTESRSGKLVNIGAQGNRANDLSGNFSNQLGKTVHSFKTIQPIIVESRNVIPEFDENKSLRIRIDLNLKNQSAYRLTNIQIENSLPNGSNFNRVEEFNPGESKLITYYADMGMNYNNNIYVPRAMISDPNEHTESLAGTEDKVVIARRNDQGAPANWTATQPDFHLPLTITLIPYKTYSPENILNIPTELFISKKVSDSNEIEVKSNTVSPDETINYKITAKNIGANSIGTLLIDDYDESKIRILDPLGGVDNGDYIRWDLGTLGNGEVREFIIPAQIYTGFPQGTYQAINTVKLGSINHPEITDSTQTTIIAKADLDIQKFVSDMDEVNVRSNNVNGNSHDEAQRTLIYTLKIKNKGTAPATGVTIQDDIRGILAKGKVLKINDNGVLNEGILTWSIGQLNPNEEKVVTFEILLNKDLQDLSKILNVASLDSDQTESISSSTETTIHSPIISLIKGADKLEYQSFEEAIYSIEVENSGSIEAVGVVKDILPEGLVFKSTNWDSTKTTINGRELIFDVLLAPYEKKKIFITVTFDKNIPDLSILHNEVIYHDSEDDNNESDTESGVDISVHAPNIKFEKRTDVSNENLKAGDKITYTISYENIGSGTLKDFKIIDEIPHTTTYVENSAKPSENFLISEGATGKRQIEWILGDLAPGSKGEVSFETQINEFSEENILIKNIAILKSLNLPDIRSNEVSTNIKKPEVLGVQETNVENVPVPTSEMLLSQTGVGISLKTIFVSFILILFGGYNLLKNRILRL